jgi:cation:H+ antiporter
VTSVLVLLVGLVILLVGGYLVVAAAERLGEAVGLAPAVIGVTVVAFATSAPELAVTLQAVTRDDPDIGVGTVVGSNIANILLVLGLAAVVGGRLRVATRIVRSDIPLMVGVSVLLLVLGLDGGLARGDGALMVVVLAAYMAMTLRATGRVPVRPHVAPAVGRIVGLLSGLVAGAVALAVAAHLVVRGASEVARSLDVPELIIGLTVVALGTSAPEIVTTLVAASRGTPDLAVGNAVGSNILNILLVLGVSALLSGDVPVSDDVLRLDLPVMVAVAVASVPILTRNHRLERWEGAVFLGYYAAYLTFLGLEAAGASAKDPFALVMVVFVIPLTVLTMVVVVAREMRGRRRSSAGRSRSDR